MPATSATGIYDRHDHVPAVLPRGMGKREDAPADPASEPGVILWVDHGGKRVERH